MGTVYETSELTYEWMQGMRSLGSGRGKNTLTVRPDTPFDALNVTVIVFDPKGVERAFQHVEIPIKVPRVVFYEDDPVLGVLYQRAIKDSFNLTKSELKLVAEPFHASVASRLDPKLEYTWTVNNAAYSFPGAIVLRPEGELFGSTDISLTALHTENFAQRMQGRLSVIYGVGSNGSFENPLTEPL
jgi:hypothetical protein